MPFNANIALFLLASFCSAAIAAPCDDPVQAEKIAVGLEGDMAALTARQKARTESVEHEITAIKRQMVQTRRWTQKQSDGFLFAPLQSKEANAMQTRMIDGMMRSAEAQQRYTQHMARGEKLKACPYALVVKDALTLAGEVKELQYQHMLATIRKATAK